jgi:heptosyltransferase III
LKNINKILIIIQRSNGDVFLSLSLINALFRHFGSPNIDLLVNEDTKSVAKLLPNINTIHTFSYIKKKNKRFSQEKELISSIYKKYDLSINLTSSDRSVIYACLGGKKSISAIEKNNKKSWWKKSLLSNYYIFNSSKHILQNNLEPLNLLGIEHELIQGSIDRVKKNISNIEIKLRNMKINKFIIFHPSAQYDYKILPQHLRDELLLLLSSLGIPILITGSNNEIDMKIKMTLKVLPNIHDFIGETSINEFFILSNLALAYIGMDTLNMHIAASQNKRIFAIFGPTNLSMWSPWSNSLKACTTKNSPIQTYGNVTIFQADMPCIACGKAGCDDNHGKSDCLFNIKPDIIFNKVEAWLKGLELETTL